MDKKKIWGGIFAGVLAAILSGAVFAEEAIDTGSAPESGSPAKTAGDGAAKPGQVDLGNVVISEEKTPIANLPASVTIIEGEELEKLHIKKGIDILRAIPGAMPIDYNQGGVPNEFVLRGFSGGHGNIVAVFLDGVPLNESTSHADGLADFNVVIPEEIERIEVIKGPFSALYGNYARAGSINIITKKRVNETTANLSLGYWDTERGALTLGRTEGRFSQYYAVEYAKSDGWRENSDYRRGNLSAKWMFDLTPNSTLKIGARSYATDFNAPGYLPGAEWDAGHFEKTLFPFDGGRKERYDVNINYNYMFGPNDSIGITAFKYHSNLTRFADFGGGQSEQNNVIDGHIAKILYSKRGSYLTSEDWLLLGADFLREDGTHLRWCTTQRVRGLAPCTTGAPSTDGDFVMDTISFFTQAEARPVQPLKVTVGARYDTFKGELEDHVAGANFDNDLNIFSPKGGVLYTLSPGYDLYANVGTGFVLPDSFDKFTNPQLKPVHLLSYEVGTRAQPSQRLRTSLAYFIIDTKDEAVTVPNQFLGFTKENKGETRRQGVEMEVQLGLTQELMWIGNFSYVRAEYTDYVNEGIDYSGKRLEGSPSYIYNTGLDYLHPAGVGGRFMVRGIGERALTADNTQTVGGYSVADTQVYYTWANYTVDLRANNLFNRHYSDAIFYFSGDRQYGGSDPFNVTASFRAAF